MQKDLYAVTLGAAIVAARQSGGSQPGSNPRERWPAANLFVAKWTRNSGSACLFCSHCNRRQAFLLQIIPYKTDEYSSPVFARTYEIQDPSIKPRLRGLVRV
jgi:hypothetical protein